MAHNILNYTQDDLQRLSGQALDKLATTDLKGFVIFGKDWSIRIDPTKGTQLVTPYTVYSEDRKVVGTAEHVYTL